MSSPSRRLLIVPILGAGLIGGAGGAAIVATTSSSGTITRTIVQPATTTQTVSDPLPSSAAGDIYDNAKDAVAFITTGNATGTGFVISADGLIVTNSHVIEGATNNIKVKLGDGDELPAEVVGTDTSTDLALLKIDGSDLPTLKLGDSSTADVGDDVFAIGNPYGLDRTLTTGVVSALARSIQAPDGFTISNVLQTDAALNPGNSGGPLLNAAGEVIGVNSQIESEGGSNSGVGFAIPSDTVKRVVAQLRATGSARHAYLGVSTGDAPNGGATIGQVTDTGPAAAAGLRQGDVITAINGNQVEDAGALSAAIDALAPGDKAKLTVTRNGSTDVLEATLTNRPTAS